jgi:hypothetical protein
MTTLKLLKYSLAVGGALSLNQFYKDHLKRTTAASADGKHPCMNEIHTADLSEEKAKTTEKLVNRFVGAVTNIPYYKKRD